jgi:hypothetical protein
MLYLARSKPGVLEHGKDVFIKDPESEPVDLMKTIL